MRSPVWGRRGPAEPVPVAVESHAAAMVDNVTINVMFADNDMVIRYMNPASLETLRSIEEHLPCRADEVVGSNIDIFHKNPAHQRGLLQSLAGTHRATIMIGGRTFRLTAVGMFLSQRGQCSPRYTRQLPCGSGARPQIL